MGKRVGKAIRCLLVAALLVMGTAAAGGESPAVRCRWASPNDRRPLDIAFTGDPLLVILPGEPFSVALEAGSGTVVLFKDGQPFREGAVLHFTAPDGPGAFFLPLSLRSDGGSRECSLCVVVPFRAEGTATANGILLRADGQEIGEYRHPHRSGNAKVRGNPDHYTPPVWWFRLTDANRNHEIAPELTAGELVAPAEDTGLPHTDLVPVHYPMWNAIVTLRQGLAERGIPGSALKLISVFRQPAYNRRIGSNAFGRHIYGDAFDFYLDLEGDGKATDLNRDGTLDRQDAYPVVALIEDLQADGQIPLGGIGVYNTVAGDHVVTLHLDLRGHRATWGYRYSAAGKRSEFSWASRRFADLDRRDEDAAAARAAREGRSYARPRREPLPATLPPVR
ncbi:MAG: hypothetical protein LIP77_11065 [Planctomycetes bacterium]|nr:hypothetical protein [Planctomycetota bacterium]